MCVKRCAVLVLLEKLCNPVTGYIIIGGVDYGNKFSMVRGEAPRWRDYGADVPQICE